MMQDVYGDGGGGTVGRESERNEERDNRTMNAIYFCCVPWAASAYNHIYVCFVFSTCFKQAPKHRPENEQLRKWQNGETVCVCVCVRERDRKSGV